MRTGQSVSLRGWPLLLGLLAATCGPHALLAPFVEVTVAALPPGVTHLQVDATFGGKTQTSIGNEGMLDRLTISLPSDAMGPLDMQVTARDAANCVVAMGQLNLAITHNELYPLTLTMRAQTPPICPGSGTVPITLTKTGGGGGSIVAVPAELSCDATCSSKMGMFDAGTVVSLSVGVLTKGPGWASTFDGWSGACMGTTTCSITLAQAATVTASFSCHGWCPESLPTETNNLNSIWAFSDKNIVAVGDGGRILQWDGTSWKRASTPVTTNLRSVSGTKGLGVGFAVGDAGTILKTTDFGASWTPMNSTTTKNLRGVWALDNTEVYAVGDNIMTGSPWLGSDGSTWSTVNLGSVDFAYNAVWGYASGNYVAVGAMGNSAVRNPFSIPTSMSTAALNGVYGPSSTTVTAVGVGATLLRYDPGTKAWGAMVPPSGTNFVNLRAIHGASASQMFAVGDNGTVWFYDGSAWRIEPFPELIQLNGVFVFSLTELYVVGQGGAIYHKKS